MPDAGLTDSAMLRRTMVDCQVRTFDVTDQTLLARMTAVPREDFLPADLRHLAYSDRSLTIAAGEARRMVLPPLILARMIQAAGIYPQDRVLDVGGAFGYSAALLAGLAAGVVALEDAAVLSAGAADRLARAGFANVRTMTGPLDSAGTAGPFDVILVNGAIETGLDGLLASLAEGGRLVAIEARAGDIAGRAGRVVLLVKYDGHIGSRPLFSAPATVLPAFRRKPEFAF